MKILTLLTTTALLSTVVLANEPRDPEVIFAKKCAMCHIVGKPQTNAQMQSMVAPPIDVAMSGVVITIDAVEGPLSDEELEAESIAFLKDYLFNPTRDKTNCEDMVVKKFGMMPSLKGFLSEAERDVVVPWVYENFKPVKINGKYKDHH